MFELVITLQERERQRERERVAVPLISPANTPSHLRNRGRGGRKRGGGVIEGGREEA